MYTYLNKNIWISKYLVRSFQFQCIPFFKLNAFGYLLKRENRVCWKIKFGNIMKTVLRLKTFFLSLYKQCRGNRCQMNGQYYTRWRIWGTVIVFQMTIFKYMIFYNNVNSKYSYLKKMFSTCNLNIIVQSVGGDHHPSDSFHGLDINFAFLK